MPIPMKCPRCGHKWIYRGNQTARCACPKCLLHCNLTKNRMPIEEYLSGLAEDLGMPGALVFKNQECLADQSTQKDGA